MWEAGVTLLVVRGLLIAVTPLILELSSALGCVGFSRCGAWAQQSWLLGPGAQASIAVARGVSYSSACGIFPDQGSNPCPLHWQVDYLPLSCQGNPANLLFKKIKKNFYWLHEIPACLTGDQTCTLCIESTKSFFFLIYFNWRLITLQYRGGFCYTLT